MTGRILRCALAAAAAVLAGALLPAAVLPGATDAARALTAGKVLGAWNVKVKGDGWAGRAGTSGPATLESARINGGGVMIVRPRDPDVNDGLLTVEVVLDEPTAKSLLGSATSGDPAFVGTAALVGDTIGLIDAGQPNYVNAMTLRFDKTGRKVTGQWMAVFPASEPTLATQKFAAAVSVTVKGRRTGSRDADGSSSAHSRRNR